MPAAELIPETRPISDLRTHLPEIEASAKELAGPIVFTRNGKPSLVVFDSEAYNMRVQRERHIVKLRGRKSKSATARTRSRSTTPRKRIDEIIRTRARSMLEVEIRPRAQLDLESIYVHTAIALGARRVTAPAGIASTGPTMRAAPDAGAPAATIARPVYACLCGFETLKFLKFRNR